MREAVKQLAKSTAPDGQLRVHEAQHRIAHMEHFVGARQALAGGDAPRALALCSELLMALPVPGGDSQGGQQEAGIRPGDVFALMASRGACAVSCLLLNPA
jgi:hypothetical protein